MFNQQTILLPNKAFTHTHTYIFHMTGLGPKRLLTTSTVTRQVDSVLHAFFHCSKTKFFIKQLESYFLKMARNSNRIIFGIKHNFGNYASNLGIFLSSKAIRVI